MAGAGRAERLRRQTRVAIEQAIACGDTFAVIANRLRVPLDEVLAVWMHMDRLSRESA